MLIGLCGYARSGKDSTARILAELADFKSMAFADALRELAYKINPYVAPSNDGEPRRYAEVLDTLGYEQGKRIDEVRGYLQRLGVGVRDVFGADVWVNALHARIASTTADVVITDVRFPNEARYVQRAGLLWRIVRPGTGPVNRHESELHQESFKVDAEIVANDLDELRTKVAAHLMWSRAR